MKLIIPLETWDPSSGVATCTVEAVYKCLRYSIGDKVSVFLEMNPEEGTTKEFEDENDILDLAIEYVLHSNYPPNLSKDKKRAMRKRAATLVVNTGEVFLKRKGCLVKVVTAADDQCRILELCHSDSTSGHFGTTKTWRRIAERFYW